MMIDDGMNMYDMMTDHVIEFAVIIIRRLAYYLLMR